MYRALLFILSLSWGLVAMAGDFFPEDYKSFPFKAGDLLVNQRSNGKFAVTKILKVDKVILKPGDTINIQGQIFTAPVEDYLLIVSASFGESEFDSFDKAKNAATSGSWTVKLGHVPNRVPGALVGQFLVGHAPVTESELVGYHQWRDAFEKGEAGIF